MLNLNQESFFHIQDWIDEIVKYTGPNIAKLVVANKSDLTNRKVTDQEMKEFELKTGIKIIEVSAKNNKNLELIFKTICEILINKK